MNTSDNGICVDFKGVKYEISSVDKEFDICYFECIICECYFSRYVKTHFKDKKIIFMAVNSGLLHCFCCRQKTPISREQLIYLCNFL